MHIPYDYYAFINAYGSLVLLLYNMGSSCREPYVPSCRYSSYMSYDRKLMD